MPAIGDLRGQRKRLGCRHGIPAAPIARDHADLGLAREPGLRRGRFAVRQQGDGPAPLEIANERAVSLIASPGPVIDADDGRRNDRLPTAPPHDPQQRVVAHQHHQPACEIRSRTPAKSKRQMMHDVLKA
jgi:hypothetical protein